MDNNGSLSLQEVQRKGNDLEKQLKALAGIKNNNPRNVPGVPYIKWQPGFIPTRNAQTLREKSKYICHCRVTSGQSWDTCVDRVAAWQQSVWCCILYASVCFAAAAAAACWATFLPVTVACRIALCSICSIMSHLCIVACGCCRNRCGRCAHARHPFSHCNDDNKSHGEVWETVNLGAGGCVRVGRGVGG